MKIWSLAFSNAGEKEYTRFEFMRMAAKELKLDKEFATSGDLQGAVHRKPWLLNAYLCIVETPTETDDVEHGKKING